MLGSEYEFVPILQSDGTRDALEASWRAECEDLDEDFDSYASLTFEILDDLFQGNNPKAWVYALKIDGAFPAICQVNRALLPGYDGPVIRVRFITLSPSYDLQERPLGEYGKVLVGLLLAILKMASVGERAAKHIKLHLASPSDQQFFQALGAGLEENLAFAAVQTHGAWLYIALR